MAEGRGEKEDRYTGSHLVEIRLDWEWCLDVSLGRWTLVSYFLLFWPFKTDFLFSV